MQCALRSDTPKLGDFEGVGTIYLRSQFANKPTKIGKNIFPLFSHSVSASVWPCTLAVILFSILAMHSLRRTTSRQDTGEILMFAFVLQDRRQVHTGAVLRLKCKNCTVHYVVWVKTCLLQAVVGLLVMFSCGILCHVMSCNVM